ncbi:MAG TPA: hypothetical protein VFF15_09680 [Flavobacteriaceae bacterium]|nr:hypothetical protein [Flavobacteriaceae bacterium]
MEYLEMYNGKKIEEIRQSAELIRGSVLSLCIGIEFSISKILVDFFAKEDKRSELYRYFLSDTLTFDQKKYTLSSIKTKLNNNKVNTSIITDLDYIQKLRNKMAHSDIYLKPDVINSFNGDNVKFMNFTNKHYGEIITINIKSEEEDRKLLYSHPVFLATANRVWTSLVS